MSIKKIQTQTNDELVKFIPIFFLDAKTVATLLPSKIEIGCGIVPAYCVRILLQCLALKNVVYATMLSYYSAV